MRIILYFRFEGGKRKVCDRMRMRMERGGAASRVLRRIRHAGILGLGQP